MTATRRSGEGTPISEEDSLLPTTGNDTSAPATNVSESRARRFAWVSLAVVAIAVGSLFFALYFRPPPPQPAKQLSSLMVDDIVLEREGKKRSECEDGDYSKRTVKTAFELPFAALFKDTKGQKTFEASGLTIVENKVYAICDNSWAISKFDDSLRPFSEANKMIGDPNRVPDEDSGYEAIFHDDGTFYVVRESVKLVDEGSEKKSYHAVIEELSLGDDDYTIVDQCPTQFEFEGDSKGFEGAIAIHDSNDELVVLGLCEGNYCSESRKHEVGHGRLIAMKKKVESDGSCTWATIGTVKIPKTAQFRDYSAITMNDKGMVAISSQEESQIWMGQMLGLNDDGKYDMGAIEFDRDVGSIYSFPKSTGCHTIYCNVEGIHFMNDEMLMGVSDRMKKGGKQDYRCFNKDQSIHAFVLP